MPDENVCGRCGQPLKSHENISVAKVGLRCYRCFNAVGDRWPTVHLGPGRPDVDVLRGFTLRAFAGDSIEVIGGEKRFRIGELKLLRKRVVAPQRATAIAWSRRRLRPGGETAGVPNS